MWLVWSQQHYEDIKAQKPNDSFYLCSNANTRWNQRYHITINTHTKKNRVNVIAQNRLVCLQDIVFLKILKSVCGKFHKLWTFWCGLRFFTFWHFFTRTKQKSQKQLVLKKKRERVITTDDRLKKRSMNAVALCEGVSQRMEDAKGKNKEWR